MLNQLPTEIISQIFLHLSDSSIPTLNACLLVCRTLCHHAMPMLWKSPFDYVASDLIQITRRAKCLIQIYLSSLSSEDKLYSNSLGSSLKTTPLIYLIML